MHVEADAEAAVAAEDRAEEDQQSEVDQRRQDLAAEQDRTLAEQQAAVDGALGELATSGDASRRAIDERLAADRATLDESYTATEEKARVEVEKGRARVDVAKGATADKAKAGSWWDWTIDTWQGFVQWFAANVVAIWEEVNQAVACLLDQAIALATDVVNGAVAFAKRATRPTTTSGSASSTRCSRTRFRSWRPHSARWSRSLRQRSSRPSMRSPPAICRRCVSRRMRWSLGSTPVRSPTRRESPPILGSGRRSSRGSGTRSADGAHWMPTWR